MNGVFRDRCNRAFDGAVRPQIRFLGRAWPAYGFFVHVGTLSGVAVICVLTALTSASLLWAFIAAVIGIAAAITMSLTTSALTGFEQYTWYHYHLMLLAVCGGVLYLAAEPVLVHLDVFNIGLLLILGIGRIGCFLGGCCHGVPHAWGIAYGEGHVETGFRRSLVGVRLFPAQILECAGLLLVVAASVVLVLDGPAGASLAFSTCAYASLRVVLEIWRGDADRGFGFGVSEAQWTGAAMIALTLGAGVSGLVPLIPASWATGIVGLLVFAVNIRRQRARRIRDEHVRGRALVDFADVVHLVTSKCENRRSDESPKVIIGTTPATGLRVSASRVENEDGSVEQIGLSSCRSPLTWAAALRVAEVLGHLHPAEGTEQLLESTHGVFHLIRQT